MADAMKGVTKALSSMNKSAKLPQINKIMMDFERESEMMDMKQEVMNDAIDDAMEDEDDEEETEQIVNQVLDEIGIGMNEQVFGIDYSWSMHPWEAYKKNPLQKMTCKHD
jgi:charged multivesicular body protein 2A